MTKPEQTMKKTVVQKKISRLILACHLPQPATAIAKNKTPIDKVNRGNNTFHPANAQWS